MIEYLSSVLLVQKHHNTSSRFMLGNMEIVNNRAPAQIKEIFAHVAITCASALPLPNMSQAMFHRDPFT